MDLSLVMFKADGTRRDFPIQKDRVVIGRKATCDLRIPLPSVSRQHCEIKVADGQATVRDLGSSNGTLHNSGRIQEKALAAGDELTVGPVVFTVVIDGEPAEIEPVRSLIEQAGSGAAAGSGAGVGSSAGAGAGTGQDTGAGDAATASTAPSATEEDDSDVYELADADQPLDPSTQAALETDADPLPGGSDDDEQAGGEIDLDDPLAALERMASEEEGDDEVLTLGEDDESGAAGSPEPAEEAEREASSSDSDGDVADADELELLSDDEEEPDQGKR